MTSDITADTIGAAPPPNVIVVMGVSGAGKSLVGAALSASLHWTFYDGDSFHTPANIAKMHRGEGLTDADRQPWLDSLAALIAHAVRANEHAVLACSALKHAYREQFRLAAAIAPPASATAAGATAAGAAAPDPSALRFVYLDVPAPLLERRLAARHDHYAGSTLLASQLATLEPPRDALWVDGTQPVDEIVRRIRIDMGI